MGHTPGPWELGEKRGVWVGPVVMADNGSRGVAFVCGESDANARLIAAAPELLAALRGVLHWAECECKRLAGDTPPNDEPPMCDYCVARLAIDKAEGSDE